MLIVAANVFAGSLETMFEVNPPERGLFHALAPVLVPTAVIALAAGAVLVLYPRLSQRARRAALAGIALADLALLFANQSFISEPISLLAATNPVATAVGRAAGPQGRFAIYNPLLLPAGAGNAVGIEAGASDLSVVHGDLNAGGYGSLLDGSYATWTGAHPAETVSPAALTGVVFDELDLRALLTLSPYLATALPPGTPATAACPARGRPPVMPCALPQTAFPAGTLHYTLPGRERVTSAGVLIDPSDPRGRVRVGVLGADGRTVWLGTVGAFDQRVAGRDPPRRRRPPGRRPRAEERATPAGERRPRHGRPPRRHDPRAERAAPGQPRAAPLALRRPHRSLHRL